MNNIAIITFPRNLDIAEKIKEMTDGDILLYDENIFRFAFERYGAIIAIMASGIVVRNIAPLINEKWKDPPVVVVDSGLLFAIPILGGHHGGNELARKLGASGLIPAITTATDVKRRESVEGIANRLYCKIINRNSTRKVNIALLQSDVEVLEIKGPKIVIVGDDVSVLKKEKLIVGIGSNRGVGASEVISSIDAALLEIDAEIKNVKYFSSATIKNNEKGIIDAAAAFGKELIFVHNDIINSIDPPTRSKAKDLGLNGVCEPAALALSEEKILLLRKKIYGNVTIAIAR